MITTHSTQASRVFAKFGGVPNLLRSLRAARKPRHFSVVYKWNAPKSVGGTGGLIPSSAIQDVMVAARLEGILLSDEDLSPARISLKGRKPE